MASAYAELRDRVIANRQYAWNLDQALGDHAISMVNYVQSQDWGDVQRANRDWVSMVASGEHPASDFFVLVDGMAKSFSEGLRFIVDDNQPYSIMEPIMEEIARFYSRLGNRSYDDMKTQWNDYARSVVRVARVYETHGKDSHSFFICAGDCVRSGQLLGRWLHHAVYRQSM